LATAIKAAKIENFTHEKENTRYMPQPANKNETALVFVKRSPKKRMPTTPIVMSMLTKKRSVADPISI